ncbi:MAG: hypothetical protein JRI95_05020 [Deltaproteobacteria bacterium]|nr:hypothetical protein [Deltaproteobacteria bacterium]
MEMMVLHASAWKNLRERQFTALTEWIRKGGYVVTASGLNYGAFLEARTRRLLPLNILGFERIFELDSLEEFCGQILTSPEPFLIAKVNIEAAEALSIKDDIPVIIQKEIGLGKIIFLAFDYQRPPFADWTGRHSFWNKILTLKPANHHFEFDLQERQILSSMISGIPIHFPGFLWAISLLALYIIFVQVLFHGIEKKVALRRKYLSYLIAIIVIFSLAGYWLFFYQTARKDLSYNSFLHLKVAEQKGITSGKLIVGLYSLQKGDYRLSLGSKPYPVTAILPKLDESETVRSLTLHESNARQTVLISLNRWSHRLFKINTMMNFPIRGEVFKDEQGLTIQVENMTPHLITDCQIYFDGRFFFFGDIAPDKKYTKKLTRSSLERKGLFVPKAAESITAIIVPNNPSTFFEKMQKNLMQDLLFSIHARYGSRPDILHLSGWINSDVIPIHLMEARRAINRNMALLEWEIPVGTDKQEIKIGLAPEAFSGSELSATIRMCSHIPQRTGEARP